MTREEFARLAGEGVILLDGATGSNLIKAGMPRGISTEQWVLEHPQVLQKLQRDYVEAGSQIVYAPTFAANRSSLKNFGLEDQVKELNRKLMQICREGVGDTALIAGDLTTTGKMVPQGDLTYDQLIEIYREQAQSLARSSGGRDDAQCGRDDGDSGCGVFRLRSAGYVFPHSGIGRDSAVWRQCGGGGDNASGDGRLCGGA